MTRKNKDKANDRPHRHRAFIRCTLCNKRVFSDSVKLAWEKRKNKGWQCKCGNVWVGPVRTIDDHRSSRWKFFVGIRYTDVRPEIAEKRVPV